jgi:Cu/Ag efflux pump CusA
LAERAGSLLRGIHGAEDVRVEQVAGLRYLRVIPDRAKMARCGFTVQDINQLVEMMSVGHLVGHVLGSASNVLRSSSNLCCVLTTIPKHRTPCSNCPPHSSYQQARVRLSIVVPLALALTLFLLWLAFRSLRTALLIFLNVPFAVLGGVAALYLREIPFSISAGVGFIALLGVAVLNGLVLVSFARQRGSTARRTQPPS